MATRIVIQLLLLPIVIVAVPLMFSLAWLKEAIDDLKPGAHPAVQAVGPLPAHRIGAQAGEIRFA